MTVCIRPVRPKGDNHPILTQAAMVLAIRELRFLHLLDVRIL